MYKISAYTKARAKKIGVNIRPSKTAGKKIDVYKNGTKLASIAMLLFYGLGAYKHLKEINKLK
jgi:hypothetical protein